MNRTKGKLLTLDDYNNNEKQFYYIKDIKKTLAKYKLNTVGKKKDLLERLYCFYNNLNSYNEEKQLKSIIYLQRLVKTNLHKKKILTQGKGILNKKLCRNHEDFYTLDSIFDIDDKYFFSYDEGDNNIYFFDIRSFSKLLKNDTKNPYTRKEIPQHAIDMFKMRLKYLKDNNIQIKEIEEPKLTKEQIFYNKVFSIFQKIDMLNVVAGGVDINWFLDLNIIQLKMYYKILEDIWNYRSQLTEQKKKEIVPGLDVFIYRVNDVYQIVSKKLLQKIILNDVNKLVSASPNEDDRRTGAYFVLTALVEVSTPCMEALPWLVQHS